MKKFLKISSIVGLCLTLLGAVCFFVGWGATGFKVSALSNVQVEKLSFKETPQAPLHTIQINYSSADIEVKFGGSEVTVEYPKRTKKNGKEISKITVKEENGTLTIREKTPVFNLFSIDFSDPIVVITLPSARVFALDLTTGNGDIKLADGGSYDSLKAEVDNGDIIIGQSSCMQNMTLSSDNGSISVADFSAKNLTAITDNGSVTLASGSVENKLSLETDNGNLKTLGEITAKTVEMETDNGNIRVKGKLNADTVSLSTDNGDIYAKLAGEMKDYTTAIDVDNGDSNIGNFIGGEKRLLAETDNGDVEIIFEK